ncbi:MAG: protein tyrosine phosphatase family protein [Chloroflexi bacterium]|nr:protein tyrosine phosphatase family protein [Chloroflexota bacterium]
MMEKIYNFLKLSESLFTSGMPTPEQVSSVAEKGVQVVVNLATSKSEGWMPNEKDLVEAQSIRYYNIPVEWSNPTAENLSEFMSIMDRHKNEKVLVHCQANYRATGFATLYRINRLGWKKEDALKDLRQIWNPVEYPIWEKFIEENIAQK